MTQGDKQLLLKDLCSRLPYDVCAHIIYNTGEPCYGKLTSQDIQWFIDSKIVIIKPYLRPLSSMTIGEEYEYHQCKNIDCLEVCEMKHTEILETTALHFSRAIDWLNKKCFDYRGLIPMGLALEAPDGMYK